jgi:hypothetical protein
MVARRPQQIDACHVHVIPTSFLLLVVVLAPKWGEEKKRAPRRSEVENQNAYTEEARAKREEWKREERRRERNEKKKVTFHERGSHTHTHTHTPTTTKIINNTASKKKKEKKAHTTTTQVTKLSHFPHNRRPKERKEQKQQTKQNSRCTLACANVSPSFHCAFVSLIFLFALMLSSLCYI